MKLIYLENKWWKEVGINDYILRFMYTIYVETYTDNHLNIVGKFSHVHRSPDLSQINK